MSSKSFIKSLTIFVILVFFAETNLAVADIRYFPAIRRSTITVETNPLKLEEAVKLVIKDSFGRPAYALWVVAGSLDKRTTHDIELSLEPIGRYSSDAEVKYERNLLSPDYWGHGVGREVIRPEELCPANRNNPVVGSVRRFVLRRMQITVKVENVEVSPDFCSNRKCGDQVGGFTRVRLTALVEPSKSLRRRPAGFDELGWKFLDLKECGSKY